MINSLLNPSIIYEYRSSLRYLREENQRHYYTSRPLMELNTSLCHGGTCLDLLIQLLRAYQRIMLSFVWKEDVSVWCRLNSLSYINNLIRWRLQGLCFLGLQRLPRRAGSKKPSFKHYHKLASIYRGGSFFILFARYFFWRICVGGLQNKLFYFLLINFMSFRSSIYADIHHEAGRRVFQSTVFWARMRSRRRRRFFRLRLLDA